MVKEWKLRNQSDAGPFPARVPERPEPRVLLLRPHTAEARYLESWPHYLHEKNTAAASAVSDIECPFLLVEVIMLTETSA